MPLRVQDWPKANSSERNTGNGYARKAFSCETRVDSRQHSGSERYLRNRMAH